MSIAIRAATLQCAQNHTDTVNAYSDSLYQHLQAPSAPSSRTLSFLNQRITLPYFNAFTTAKLGATQLLNILCHHLTQASIQAGWPPESLSCTPIFIGSTAYLMSEREHMLTPSYVSEIGLDERQHNLNHVAEYLRNHWHNDDVFSFATSCTSSANALAYATKMLQAGWCQRALVLGFENFNALTFEYFHAMGLLSTTPHYTPFAQTDGFICGEAVGCLALEYSHTKAPATIRSVASDTDTLSLTATHNHAMLRLMQAALADAAPEHIQLVKSHGIGSTLTDAAEAHALSALLPNTPWAAFKPFIGHTLGATAVAEIALLLACLHRGALPPLPQNSTYNASDLALASNGMQLNNGLYLMNFFGFAGSNISMVLEYHA